MRIGYLLGDDGMFTSRTGKLDIRGIMAEFEKTLTDKYGVKMADVFITRADALTAFHKTGCPIKAAEECAALLKLKPISSAA